MQDFGIALPPNARVAALTFDSDRRTLRIALEGGRDDASVTAPQLRAFHGARIRYDLVTRTPPKSQGPAWSGLALMATTGLPVGLMRKAVDPEIAIVGEELQYAVGIRVDGVQELWYLLAASFNFRKALGAGALYSTELNLKELVRRLTAFAPQAVQDSFFAALAQGLTLPPPLGSLVEFFRIASR